MAIDGGRACIQPQLGRTCCAGNGLADDARRLDPRFHNLAPVGLRLAAVDAASGKIDDHVRFADLLSPSSERTTIPADHRPGRGISMPGKNNYRIIVTMEVARQNTPYLSSSSGNHDVGLAH